MVRRRSAGPRITKSRLDPTDFDASPFTVSMYPSIDAFTDRGQIVIGHIDPVGAVAIATEGRETIAMLRRRENESFKQLLGRLDAAISSALVDNICYDEVNPPKK